MVVSSTGGPVTKLGAHDRQLEVGLEIAQNDILDSVHRTRGAKTRSCVRILGVSPTCSAKSCSGPQSLVKSLDGEALAAIGPERVEFPTPYMVIYGEFGFEKLDPQIEIPGTVEPQP